MGPGIVPAEGIYAGDAWARTFTFTQAGAPVDLVSAGWTGWTAQWRLSSGSANSTAITVDDSNAATGVIVLSLTGAQTEAMTGDGVWDLQATNAGNTLTWLRGTTTWTQDVTR